MSNKNEKKNRLNILRVKIKGFIVPFLNVQSIMCTLTRFNKQRSKKMNICTSKLYLRLTFRWIIQNVALLKQHISLIRENWSILLLWNMRNFRVFCLNSAALKPTFQGEWALYYFCDRLPLTLEKRDKKSDLPQSSSSTKSKISQVKDGRNLALNHILHQS